MTTSTIHLPPELRAEMIDYLVKQNTGETDEAREYWETFDGQELIDAYNYARKMNGLPMRIFTLPGERSRYRDQEPGSWQEA